MAAALSTAEMERELAACEVTLPQSALEKLSTYLALLMHWNRRINLTGLRQPRLIVRRLFGESLFLARVVELEGWLVDVGSGAGFPGLALKLAAPALRVTLLEPRRRRAAFLKEVARACAFATTEVVMERFEDWVDQPHNRRPDLITTRAVKINEGLLQRMGRFLYPRGTLALFTTTEKARDVVSFSSGLVWKPVVPIPGSMGSALLMSKVVV